MTGLVTVGRGWAIVRLDEGIDRATDAETAVNYFYVKSVILDHQLALAEVARLNELNGPKGCHYFLEEVKIRDSTSNVVP